MKFLPTRLVVKSELEVLDLDCCQAGDRLVFISWRCRLP